MSNGYGRLSLRHFFIWRTECMQSDLWCNINKALRNKTELQKYTSLFEQKQINLHRKWTPDITKQQATKYDKINNSEMKTVKLWDHATLLIIHIFEHAGNTCIIKLSRLYLILYLKKKKIYTSEIFLNKINII